MNFFFIVAGRARLNYLWLPGFIFADPNLQLVIGKKVEIAFYDKHGRKPTTSEEDLEEMDNMAIEALEPYVPFSGWKEYIQHMKKVEPLGHKVKDCFKQLELDKRKYLGKGEKKDELEEVV
jgi:hypothetical protein